MGRMRSRACPQVCARRCAGVRARSISFGVQVELAIGAGSMGAGAMGAGAPGRRAIGAGRSAMGLIGAGGNILGADQAGNRSVSFHWR